MKNNAIRLAILASALAALPVHAADWSAQVYDFYFGDFDGDGKTDQLFVAKAAAGISGIDLSDGTQPSIPLQRWASNYLGIAWSGNQYSVIVADFNGDSRSDILLQRNAAGDSYILLADTQGKFSSISRTIGVPGSGNSIANIAWTADQHRIIAGNFDNDTNRRADLFFQATSPSGYNYVLFSDSSGIFSSKTAPDDSWNSSYLGFNWSTTQSIAYAGNFDGMNGDDLLIQERPKFVMINYDVPFPVPIYGVNKNGIVFNNGSGPPFFPATNYRQWSHIAYGADWSTLASNIIVGDFNGDGKADVILQGKSAGRASSLLTGTGSWVAGSIFSNIGSFSSSGGSVTADSYKLSAVNFSGSSTGVYFQGLTAATPNLFGSVTGSSVSATATTPPVAAEEVIEYTYDALGRLTVVNRTGVASANLQTTYSLDAAGNRSAVTTIPSP